MRRALVSIGVVCLAAVSASGQSQAPPVFRAEANLVEVIVRVTDAQGRFVKGLTPTDFRLEEEGRREEIVAFNYVDSPRPTAPPIGMARPFGDRPLTSTVASNAGVDDARLFVLVLDNASSSPDTTLPVRRLARDFVERFVGPSDLVTAFPTRGSDRLTQEFTTDKARVLQTIDSYMGNRCRGTESEAERVYIARVVTDVLGAIAKHLALVRGRRVTLIWISEGFDGPNWNMRSLQRGTSSTFGNAIVAVDPNDPGTVVHAINVALKTLTQTNLTIYGVDPRQLAVTGTLGENPCGYPPGAGKDILRTFSAETGGFAVLDSNDYTAQFVRILEESSEYYVLGYQPSRQSRDGNFRRIRVRATRPDLARAVVTARAGYTVSTSPKAPEPGPPGSTPGIANAIAASVPLGRLPLRVQAVPRRGLKGRGTVHVIVEAGAKDLEFVAQDGMFTERLEFGLVAVDRLVRQSNVQNVAMDLKFTAAQLAQVRQTGVRWLTTLDLPPGQARLRFATHAVSSKHSGTIYLDVDVPKYEDEDLRIDGVALTSAPAALAPTSGTSPTALGLPGPPTANRTFVKGETVTVVAEIGVSRDFVRGALELALTRLQDDGVPIRSWAVDLPDAAAAVLPRPVDVDTATLDAGKYILQLTVRDNDKSASTAVVFDVVAQTPGVDLSTEEGTR